MCVCVWGGGGGGLEHERGITPYFSRGIGLSVPRTLFNFLIAVICKKKHSAF